MSFIKYMSKHVSGNKTPVLIDGARSAFVKSFGVFEECDTLELYSRTLTGLLNKISLDPNEIDEISAGVVVPQTKNPNVARDTILNLNLPAHIHGYTINRACTSSMHTIADACKSIAYGQPNIFLSGGVEVLSDVPIVYSKAARRFLVKFSKAKSAASKLFLLSRFSAKAWLPKPPSLSEPLTGLTMGQHAEIMAKKNIVSRVAQDQFALLSHQRAAKAQSLGYFKDEIIPIWPAPNYAESVAEDNVVRADTTFEKLSELKPAFDREAGTITAGNSSPITDGAAICMIADEARAKSLGLSAKAKIKDIVWVGIDPNDQLLIGPAIAIPLLLKNNNLSISDIDRFEIHEAFAAQVLSCQFALSSKDFYMQHFGSSAPIGEIPIEKLNVNGGAIALGHPFGATGARLLMTTANELIRSGSRYGVIAICAAGGMAGAMLIENVK